MSRIYTPGVGAVCKEIAKNPASSYRYTCRGNSIALISDGSQVYEFGNIGAGCCPSWRPSQLSTRLLPTWTPFPSP